MGENENRELKYWILSKLLETSFSLETLRELLEF